MLQSMGSQRVRHNQAIELMMAELNNYCYNPVTIMFP